MGGVEERVKGRSQSSEVQEIYKSLNLLEVNC